LNEQTFSASVIAKWFLAWAAFEDEGVISNLKLQKLLYYAQGHFLATHEGRPLFGDEIQAWAHGPVVPAVYREYKSYGSAPIEFNENFDFSSIDDDTGSWLVAIWDTFGSRSAWKLREMTHSEPPWNAAFDPNGWGATISLASMRRYFGGLYAGVSPV
jgi:uncharacterized phage-associated protein